MRTDATDAERVLWRHLRAHRFAGRKFKRQQPIGPFIVDFVCFEARLIIKVDGGHHMNSSDDARRDKWLREQGFAVLRVWNNDVLARTNAVLDEIFNHLHPSPPARSHALASACRSGGATLARGETPPPPREGRGEY